MQDDSSRSRGADSPILERAIVLVLVSEDRPQGWGLAELSAELDVSVAVVQEVVRGLSAEGVLSLRGARALASRAVRRLDELGLLGI